MSNTVCDRPDVSAFTRLDGLGLEVTGQRIEPDHAVLACRITGEDRWCRRCGCQGISRGTVVRRLAHEPYGWRTLILHVSVCRYRCPECAHVWCQGYEPSGRSSCQGLVCGGVLGADGRGRSSRDGGAHLPGPRRVLEYRQHRCPG